MAQGWIEPTRLDLGQGGTTCFTLGCPDDFYAVRIGFANATPASWRLTKVVGRPSSAFGNYVHPTGAAPWVAFAPPPAGAADDIVFPDPDAPTEITVAAPEGGVGGAQAPRFTWTGWAPIRSLGPDPMTGLRVVMLRALVPSEQTICYAVGQMRSLLGNRAVHGGFDCFSGGLKFDIDRVNSPDSSESTITWIDNQLAAGSVFPIVQFLTKNPGQTGLLIGDSHQQGTSTTEQMTNFLYRAVTGAIPHNLGAQPLGFVNAAQGGLNSAQFFARLHAWINAIRPSYVVLPGWTYNDNDGDERADRPTMERFFARLLGAAEACVQHRALPIFTTPFPRDAERMGPAQLAGWRWLRAEILGMRKTGAFVLDTAKLLSEEHSGELTGTYLSAFSTDGSHPDDAGHAAIAALFIDFLSRRA